MQHGGREKKLKKIKGRRRRRILYESVVQILCFNNHNKSIHNRLNPRLMTSSTSRKLGFIHMGLGLCYWTNISLTLKKKKEEEEEEEEETWRKEKKNKKSEEQYRDEAHVQVHVSIFVH